MMTARDTLVLLRAGYSRAEIDEMEREEAAEEAATSPAAAATPATPPAAAAPTTPPAAAAPTTPPPAATPTTPPAKAAPDPFIASLMEAMKGIDIPPEITLEQKMADTLRAALGVRETEGKQNG